MLIEFLERYKQLEELNKFFRPSPRSIILTSWLKSKGFEFIDIMYYKGQGVPKCYICGREMDLIFDFVKLIPFLDMSLDNKLVYTCDDHGQITDYNCITGETVQLPLPKPYWYRIVRNLIQSIILYSVYVLRFSCIFPKNVYTWYVSYYVSYCVCIVFGNKN